MNRFYFNECLPEMCEKPIQDIFESTIRAYHRIVKDPGLKIEDGIITHKIPSEMLVCGINLGNIIQSCSDKELRKIAFRYFTKYPIDLHYNLTDIFDDDSIGLEYRYCGYDATNLIIAHRMGWFLLSLPLCESLQTDILHINSGDDYFDVDNWHGANTDHIARRIAERSGVRHNKVQELRYCFGTKECTLSEAFVSSYMYSPTNLQEFVIEKFQDALGAGLLFPARHDDNLVKICKGSENEQTYELRSRAFGGMRVYFNCDQDHIYIGGIGTKASSTGKEQSADISRASNEIRKLKSS